MKNRLVSFAALAALLGLPLLAGAAPDKPGLGKQKGPFVTADANGDGKLDKAEYLAMAKAKAGEKFDETKAGAAFAAADTNKNGSVDREEFRATMKKAMDEKGGAAGEKMKKAKEKAGN